MLAYHTLRLSTLKRYANPLVCWPELEGVAINSKEVADCLSQGEEALRKTPSWIELALVRKDISLLEARQRHVQKIAYFVRHAAMTPIRIDVTEGVGHLVEDGNHRLAGALLRGDKEIRAKIAGPIERAQQLGLWNPSPAVFEQYRRWGVESELMTKKTMLRPRMR